MARPVVLTVEIDASPERVWRALTAPTEVVQWAGVTVVDVTAGYPAVGQHARWRLRYLGLPVTLHDRVRVVEEPVRFAARIDVAVARLEEEYRLEPLDGGRTRLTSHNDVSGRLPGLGPLAVRLARREVSATMAALAAYCATTP